ncbi:MAG: helicase-related protein, partial [Chthoniobacterales bacterium]
NYDSVLIFTRTKDGADRISRQLKKNNHSVATLHSNRTQTERVDALEGFKGGRYEVMVATDIAARGIDVAGVSHVINYDIPQHPEDYVHRIGRTGRAQRTGDAFTLVAHDEMKKLAAIERFIGQKIDRLKLEGANVPKHGEEVIAARRPKPEPRMDGRPAFRGPRRRRFGRRRD